MKAARIQLPGPLIQINVGDDAVRWIAVARIRAVHGARSGGTADVELDDGTRVTIQESAERFAQRVNAPAVVTFVHH